MINRTCTEKKLSLSGSIKRYECQLITLNSDYGVLKYRLQQAARVSTLTLAPGTTTYGVYWTRRPYNVYRWVRTDSTLIGSYFNIADSVCLQPTEFAWRDLVVDVLIRANGVAETLDEDELDPDLDDGTLCYIQATKTHILAEQDAILAEVDWILREHVG